MGRMIDYLRGTREFKPVDRDKDRRIVKLVSSIGWKKQSTEDISEEDFEEEVSEND